MTLRMPAGTDELIEERRLPGEELAETRRRIMLAGIVAVAPVAKRKSKGKS
jgi:hypothetical protein